MRVFRGWDIMKVLIHFFCKLYWTSSCGWETSKLIWTVAHCNWIVILVFYRMVFYEIGIGILRSEKVPKEQNVWKGTQKVRLLGVWWKFYYSSCGLPCHKTSIIICTSQTRYATNMPQIYITIYTDNDVLYVTGTWMSQTRASRKTKRVGGKCVFFFAVNTVGPAQQNTADHRLFYSHLYLLTSLRHSVCLP